MEGKVRVAGQTERKPSRLVDDGVPVEVEAPQRFVSRGGEKLEGAFALWGAETGDRGARLSAEGKICLDVGSSTGGFTDCLLQHGAEKVMAVDVGTNQLAYKIRTDPRVWVRENYNARFMKPEDLPDIPALAVTDVSFISQFEVGKGNAPGGLVRDESLRLAARDGIVRFASDELGLELLGLAESPIRGREMGNVEYLSWWRRRP